MQFLNIHKVISPVILILVCSSTTFSYSNTQDSTFSSSESSSSRMNPLEGPPGPRGPTGPEGIQGPRGYTGPRGVHGESASTGATGPTGEAGATGAAGIPGTAVNTGPIGPTGPASPIVTAGPTGPTGSTGPTGASGTGANTGPAGSTGPSFSSNYLFATAPTQSSVTNTAIIWNAPSVNSGFIVLAPTTFQVINSGTYLIRVNISAPVATNTSPQMNVAIRINAVPYANTYSQGSFFSPTPGVWNPDLFFSSYGPPMEITTVAVLTSGAIMDVLVQTGGGSWSILDTDGTAANISIAAIN